MLFLEQNELLSFLNGCVFSRHSASWHSASEAAFWLQDNRTSFEGKIWKIFGLSRRHVVLDPMTFEVKGHTGLREFSRYFPFEA